MNQYRHDARIVALQALYQLDVQRAPLDVGIAEVLAPLLQETGLSGELADYARILVAGTWSNRERYDAIIAGASSHWDVARMAVVDRNILRMAMFELIERLEVPTRVILDEAIEIGREFGAGETPQFINGVLDAIWKNDPTCRIARPQDAPPGTVRT